VSGNVIITTNTLNDSGYDNLLKIGGIAQAYITMKFPDLFGNKGGLAWTVGAFSNRYGNAGPRQESTGYYGTYLFGRTHVAGEALTANVDLNGHMELVVEDGFGAKLEVTPYVQLAHSPPPPIAPYLPYQGPVPKGSTFVHHAHVSLLVDDWLTVSGHFLQSFSPNDFANQDGFIASGQKAASASMTIAGGEIHVDGPKLGSGYVGYSHISATSILPLAGGVEVIHGTDGFGFTQNYFGKLADLTVFDPSCTPPVPLSGTGCSQAGYSPTAPRNDSGKVDTVLAQYILRLAPLMGKGRLGPDVAIGVFGMYNHITAPNQPKSLSQDRLKFGGEIDIKPLRFMAAAVRFDRVLPDGPTTDFAYSALSPRLIFHTSWLSREYIVASYSRYFYGSKTVASAPYTRPPAPDPNLVVVSALISF
jgi:hypothetical protein